MERVYNSAVDAFFGECAVRDRDPVKLTRIMGDFAEATRKFAVADNLNQPALRLDWFQREGNAERLVNEFREHQGIVRRAADAVSKAESRRSKEFGRQIVVSSILQTPEKW